MLSCLTRTTKVARPFSTPVLGEACLMTRGPETGQRWPEKHSPSSFLFLKPWVLLTASVIISLPHFFPVPLDKVHAHVCTHACVHTHIHAREYICIQVLTYIGMCTQLYVYILVHVCVHTYVCIYSHTCMGTHAQLHMHYTLFTLTT